MFRRLLFVCVAVAFAAGVTGPAGAGVVNPDISVIGQPFARWTDDASDASRKRVVLGVGETEFVFDAYLNPYARGTFVVALGEAGVELEEGYFTHLRGLPAKLALKGGNYRVGFGKSNPAHYGPQHIMYRGSGNSAQVAELSPALLHIIATGEAL